MPLVRHFGKDGATSWINGCAFASYAAIKALETARNVSAQCGEMTVEVQVRFRANPAMSDGTIPTADRDGRKALTLQRRPLIMPHEITQQIRKDEQIIIVQGHDPIQCGRAIYFRRKDTDADASPNRFVKALFGSRAPHEALSIGTTRSAIAGVVAQLGLFLVKFA